MITREDAQRFFSQDKVWVYRKGKEGEALEGKPMYVNRGDEAYGNYAVFGSLCIFTEFSLEDPRPKRVFENGALYPIRLSIDHPNCALIYDKAINNFRFGNHKYCIEQIYFIGEKLPSSLWEDK